MNIIDRDKGFKIVLSAAVKIQVVRAAGPANAGR